MNDFYVTIPSNTNVQGNTTSVFRVNLPTKIDLLGHWKVALVEIQYPYSWFNVRVESKDGKNYEHAFLVEKITPPEEHDKQRIAWERFALPVPDGNYSSVADLCDALNSAGAKELGLPAMFITNHRIQGRVYFEKPENVRGVILSDTFAYMLGFPSANLTESQIAKGMPDMRNGIDTFYIYCSIIAPQMVGDTMEQLLRTVAISGRFGDTVVMDYPTPHYASVLCKEFSSIEFSIKDDQNLPIPFNYGKVIIKLHFKNESGVFARFS
jgi:hypothetical protein